MHKLCPCLLALMFSVLCSSSSANVSKEFCASIGEASGETEFAPTEFVLDEGPFVRANGDTVGELELGIRRREWQRWPFKHRCRIRNIAFRFEIRDSRTDPANFMFFQFSHFSINGYIILRDRYGNTLLRIARPTKANRQQTILVKYFSEQRFSMVLLDVLYIATAWEDFNNG